MLLTPPVYHHIIIIMIRLLDAGILILTLTSPDFHHCHNSHPGVSTCSYVGTAIRPLVSLLLLSWHILTPADDRTRSRVTSTERHPWHTVDPPFPFSQISSLSRLMPYSTQEWPADVVCRRASSSPSRQPQQPFIDCAVAISHSQSVWRRRYLHTGSRRARVSFWKLKVSF